jgi:hypothetical protein
LVSIQQLEQIRPAVTEGSSFFAVRRIRIARKVLPGLYAAILDGSANSMNTKAAVKINPTMNRFDFRRVYEIVQLR